MVQGSKNVNPELLDMVRKLAARVEAIELVQNCERHLHEVESDEYDYFWDDLHEIIDDLEKPNLSLCLWITKNIFWPIKEIMKRRR